MLIANALLELTLPHVTSLKGRRKIVASIKERLRHKNLSLLDISGEYPKEATIAICFLAPNEPEALKKLQSIERSIERHWPEIPYSLTYELL